VAFFPFFPASALVEFGIFIEKLEFPNDWRKYFFEWAIFFFLVSSFRFVCRFFLRLVGWASIVWVVFFRGFERFPAAKPFCFGKGTSPRRCFFPKNMNK